MKNMRQDSLDMTVCDPGLKCYFCNSNDERDMHVKRIDNSGLEYLYVHLVLHVL